MDLEDRLERIERLLARLLERIEALERLIGLGSLEARVAVELAARLTEPVEDLVAAVARAARAAASMERYGVNDAVSRAIVEVLAVKGPMSLRGLEREVRRVRGKASRSVIRERIRTLERLGIVRVRRAGRRLVISLATEEEAGEPSSTAARSVEAGGRPVGGGAVLREAEAVAGGEEEGLAASAELEAEKPTQPGEEGAGGGVPEAAEQSEAAGAPNATPAGRGRPHPTQEEGEAVTGCRG